MLSLNLCDETSIIAIYVWLFAIERSVVKAEVKTHSLKLYNITAEVGVPNRQRIVDRCGDIVSVLYLGEVETSWYKSSRVECEIR